MLFSGKIRNSQREIRVLWLRDGETKDFRAKTIAKLGEVDNISQKLRKMVTFSGRNKPTVDRKFVKDKHFLEE